MEPLAFGEWFVVAYVGVAIVVAPYFPRYGARLGEWLGRRLGSSQDNGANGGVASTNLSTARPPADS